MNPHKQLFYEYTAMYRPYMNQLNAQLSSFNLFGSQWAIMHFILHEGAHTISDISLHQNVEKPTTTKMVQKLIELGLVEARPGIDKRTKFITLTENGRKVCSQVQDKLNQYQRYLLEDVSEDEQLLVARILRDISEKVPKYKG